MNKLKKQLLIIFMMSTLCCCQTTTYQRPSLIPSIVPNTQKTPKPEKPRKITNIIGAVEPIYMLPMKSAFYARIDTGATTSSIDVINLKRFERDGEKWVSFTVTNRRSGETHNFEKQIFKRVRITRAEEHERRVKVFMDVKFGGEIFKAEFTLAEREDFDYQALIGRNILTGRAIVDTSISNTLK
ncbi:MAG: ATP-dependent zinc protease [Alphaproteobacteria bacterium]|nr:ATP-dependent zinc protease [Alphaproteobacteria bacterium]